jgi:predicted metallo-beta-lactamase superfamily hydrolase
MEITPLAAESMGVRSMCTCVQTQDVRIVIDPAVALAPQRYGLPPHKLEEEEKARLWKSIKDTIVDADILIITHYHYDHVDPEEPDIYSGKKVFLKHPSRMINPSQKKRAASFLKSIRRLTSEIEYADNRLFSHGDTEIHFSRPVPHGSDAIRGYVVEVCVDDGERFLHTSDVQGPLLDEHVSFILGQKPSILLVDGPSTYLNNPRVEIELRKANEFLLRILREGTVNCLILDHHLTRDIDFRERILPIHDEAINLGITVQTSAEFLDGNPNLLEANRKELHRRGG